MQILLLVQENSRCIELLTKAIQEKLTMNDSLYVWEIKNVLFSDDKSSISNNGHEQLLVKDISLVVKRTWGPSRKHGLNICKSLEGMGVRILNGCGFIEWSHSKIQQYITLAQEHKADLFPKTVCVRSDDIENFINKATEHDLAKHILEKMHPDYKFPMVLKKNKGCRADGVYLIDSLNTFQDLLVKDLESLREGFLLQEYITSHVNDEISNYYRINVVSNKAQSAMQFQLVWKKNEDGAALKLVDFPESIQMPIDLKIFPEKRLQEIINACPYKQDVVGIDVMFNDGQMYLLEYNDGPAVGLIVDLGEKYLNSKIPEELNAAKACYNFAEANADICLKLASPEFANNQQRMTFEFDNLKAKSETTFLEIDKSSPNKFSSFHI